jgi:hypothetical protein
MAENYLNKDGNNKYTLYSKKNVIFSNPIEEFGDYTMKIGKHKGKSITEILAMPKGKDYLYWFRDNVVNETNEKFYGKIMRVVQRLRDMDDFKKDYPDEK